MVIVAAATMDAVMIEILMDVTINYIYWFLFSSLLYHKNKMISSFITLFSGHIEKGRTSKFLTERANISIEQQ